MGKKIIYFIVVFLGVNYSLVAQKQSYSDYLFSSDSNSQSSLLVVKFQYLQMPKNVIFRSGGLHFNVGINLTRFFTKKIIFGLCADFKLFPGFTTQNLNQTFINDFNSNFNTNQSNHLDSVRGDILYKVVNNQDGYRMKGNIFINYGFCISLFPQKYGGILLELKKGSNTYPFYGSYQTIGLTKDNSPVNFEIKDIYSVEVSFKPYKFFKSGKIKILKKKQLDFYKFAILSFYYEQFSLSNSKINGVSISNYLSPQFLSKNSMENHIGIKVGFAIY